MVQGLCKRCQVSLSLLSLRKFSAACEEKRGGKKPKTEKKRWGWGVYTNVSSLHKWRKLPTLLFHEAKVWTIYMQLPSQHLFLSAFLCSVICGRRCCGFQMLYPTVRLPGHMDLQLVAWACCFASKQILKGPCCFSLLSLLCVLSYTSLGWGNTSTLHVIKWSCIVATAIWVHCMYCIWKSVFMFLSVNRWTFT